MQLAEILKRATAKDPTLTEIYMLFQKFSPEEIKQLATVLPACSALHALILPANNLGNEGIKILAKMLPACGALSELYLWDNHIGVDGATALAAVLPACPGLNILYLGANQIGAEGAKALASVLPACSVLSDLSLGNNNIGNEGATALASVLPQCSALSQLEVSKNNIGIEGAIMLTNVLPFSSTLSNLYLGDNNLEAETNKIYHTIESILKMNRRWNTALMQAIMQGDLAKAKSFYQQGASLCATEVSGSKYEGYTPLLLATSHGQLDMVKWLLENGCRDLQRAWAKNTVALQDQRKTALEIAKTRGFKKLATILQAAQLAEAKNARTVAIPTVKPAVAPFSVLAEVKQPAHGQHSSGSLQANQKILNESLVGVDKIAYQQLIYGKRLGKGGFGMVFQGKYGFTDVAIKEFLQQQLTDEALRKFNNEATLMSQLHHPNIVTLYGVCLEAPHYSLVMELMPHYSLWNFLRTSQEISWEIRSNIALDITAGVAFLHDQDILHRDLKSSNILLDGHFRAKICDFGLAKLKKEPCTQKTKEERVGTLKWMAPELFAVEIIYSKATDIYSYGMVLWELSTQKEPYADTKDNTLIAQRIKDGKKETIPEDCPETLATLITECWHSESQKRISAAAALESLLLWKNQKQPVKTTVDNAQSSAVGHNENIESKQSLSQNKL